MYAYTKLCKLGVFRAFYAIYTSFIGDSIRTCIVKQRMEQRSVAIVVLQSLEYIRDIVHC